VVATLRLAGVVTGYAADEIGNGASPDVARKITADAARELAALARILRRLSGPVSPAERRRAERRTAARELRGAGLPVRVIAARLGVTHPTVMRDLARPGYLDSTAGELAGRAGS
jgi:DNA-binding transcriptional ArsR family regulator